MNDHMTITVERKSTQRTVNVTHADVVALCAMAGMAAPDKDNPLRLGSPARGEKDYFVLECVTKDGEAYELVQGDTHAIWDTPKHQGEGVGAEKLTALIDRLPKGGKAVLRVTGVRWVQAGEKPDAPEAIEI
jgi:GNAT superfamily N-acetyltransferase